MKIIKDILASLACCFSIIAVILLGSLFFVLYIAGALPWDNIPTMIAAKKYLKETYSEPMKVISSNKNERSGYSVSAKTINEPVIEFEISVNYERTEFADNFYEESAFYYLNSDLEKGINDLYGDFCTVGIYKENNLFENSTVKLEELQYSVNELKDITANNIRIYVSVGNNNYKADDYWTSISASDILAVNDYIISSGFKPCSIVYNSVSDTYPHYVKDSKKLLEINYDKDMNIISCEGVMENNKIIQNLCKKVFDR